MAHPPTVTPPPVTGVCAFPAEQVSALQHAFIGLADAVVEELGESRRLALNAECPHRSVAGPSTMADACSPTPAAAVRWIRRLAAGLRSHLQGAGAAFADGGPGELGLCAALQR